MHWLERTELLIGPENLNKLRQANILVVGLGGVGSFAAEFLGRAGIGRMTIVDGDTVDPTNKNRQLVALDSTVGLSKAEVMAARLHDINPELELTVVQAFQEPGFMEELVRRDFDFVLDCIDSFSPKLQLIFSCQAAEVPFISSMGAGAKVDPGQVEVTDIFKTRQCPLAQQLRKLLRRRGRTRGFPVVTSTEEIQPDSLRLTDGSQYKKSFYGTISYMPALFGLHMAAYVIRALMDQSEDARRR